MSRSLPYPILAGCPAIKLSVMLPEAGDTKIQAIHVEGTFLRDHQPVTQ